MAQLSAVIGQSHSLKEKRMVLRRIKDRVKERLGVPVAEVGAQDAWQRAELGVAVVSSDPEKARAVLDDVVRVARAAAASGGAEIVSVSTQIERFAGEAQALPPVDDRTGAGDKAGADDWVPDAWREEADS
ncbi:MAG TPA: DUF503 domain-containing protein [Kofleriaceae bacterium]